MCHQVIPARLASPKLHTQKTRDETNTSANTAVERAVPKIASPISDRSNPFSAIHGATQISGEPDHGQNRIET